MSEQIAWEPRARLPIGKAQDVLLARFVGRDEGAKLGFSPALLTRLATVISEITRNVVQHADGPGEIQIGRVAAGDRRGLRVIVSDKGKGMARPEQFLEEGNQRALGSGLAGARKLADRFEIRSALGVGTTVTMDMWTQKESP